MIKLEHVHCSSRLHDSCGVVFEYQGRILRALTERGRTIFDLITDQFDSVKLAELGFIVPRATEFDMPGYSGVVEVDCISPMIPPSLWTTDITVSACQTLCRLCREFLKHDYVLWDLGSRDNLAFNAKRGTMFVDMGALHSLDELKNRELSTSFDSLFEQFVDSFYLPLWLSLGPMRSKGKVVQLLNYSRVEPRNGPAKAILKRLLLGGRVIPGWYKARRMVKRRQLDEFYTFVDSQVTTWYRKHGPQKVTPSTPKGFVAEVTGIIQSISPETVFYIGTDSPVADRLAADGCEVYDISGGAGWPHIIRSERSHALASDIWDRTMTDALTLKGKCEVVVCGPDLFALAERERVPIDFAGRVLGTLTSDIAIVGISNSIETNWPGFVSSPDGENSADFIRSVIGEYFGSSEVIRHSDDTGSIIRFRK